MFTAGVVCSNVIQSKCSTILPAKYGQLSCLSTNPQLLTLDVEECVYIRGLGKFMKFTVRSNQRQNESLVDVNKSIERTRLRTHVKLQAFNAFI